LEVQLKKFKSTNEAKDQNLDYSLSNQIKPNLYITWLKLLGSCEYSSTNQIKPNLYFTRLKLLNLYEYSSSNQIKSNQVKNITQLKLSGLC
jgi:hypothetical protein